MELDRLLTLTPERLAAERRRGEEAQEASRQRARTVRLTIVAAAGWWMLGMVLLGLSLNVGDQGFAASFFWAALGVGNAGPLYTALRFHARYGA